MKAGAFDQGGVGRGAQRGWRQKTFSAAGLIRSAVIQETEVGFAKLGGADTGFSTCKAAQMAKGLRPNQRWSLTLRWEPALLNRPSPTVAKLGCRL